MNLRALLPVASLLALAALLAPLPASAAAPPQPVYAHRGGTSQLVENTRENYARATAAGSLLWETDVRFTSTNYPVLLHDAHLGKFGCADVKIASVSVPKARECAAANGQTLTTLYEFVTDLSSAGAKALIELKTVPTEAQWKILETRISTRKDRVVIQSFLPAALTAASQRGYETAYLTKTAVSAANLPAGTDWYAPQWQTLTAAQVTSMHAAGVKVVTWSPGCSQWPSMPKGVDAMISDDLVSECA